MTIALLHNHYDEQHLADVIEYMRAAGAPTIRVYNTGVDSILQAVEGCHRLRACELLGVTPNIIELDGDTLIAELDLDYDGCGEYLYEIGDWQNYTVKFNDNN